MTNSFSFFDDYPLSSSRTLRNENSSHLFLLLHLLLFISLNLDHVHFRCSEKDDTSKWKYVVRGDARCEYHGILKDKYFAIAVPDEEEYLLLKENTSRLIDPPGSFKASLKRNTPISFILFNGADKILVRW